MADRGVPSRVLVVDDDLGVLGTAVQALRDEGYDVRSARNGKEALEILRLEPTALPRVILLDLMMPQMDGREFRLQQLRDPLLAKVPIVLFTADPSAFKDAAVMQVNAVISKPAPLAEILQIVARFCSRLPPSR